MMDDKQIFTALRSCLLNGFESFGLNNVAVLRAYQPTTQGRDDGIAVYMSKVLDQRIGHPERFDKYRYETDDFLHTETQWYESTFQIMAMVEENPSDADSLTATDILSRTAYILQSDSGLASLTSKGLKPLRITTIRTPYFTNDKGQFEASPSFDIILTHKQSVTSVNPAAQTITGKFDNGYKH